LAVVCVRFMILAVNQRASSDDRTLGELVWTMTAEAAEISFSKTLRLILEALLDTVRAFFSVSDEQMEAFTQSFLSKLLQHLYAALGLSQARAAA
ncbi:MAG: transposase, partial [Oscillospiraceae bacterium]|nr:transposase [Oscillospiraceae bacterium]